MEQLLAFIFLFIAIAAAIAIFFPSLEAAICRALRLSKWTPLSDTDLLLFAILLPLWLFWGFTSVYWSFFEKHTAGIDTGTGLIFFWLIGVFYLLIIISLLNLFLPLEYLQYLLSGTS